MSAILCIVSCTKTVLVVSSMSVRYAMCLTAVCLFFALIKTIIKIANTTTDNLNVMRYINLPFTDLRSVFTTAARCVAVAYKTLVRPKLEYAACSWDPYTTQQI